MSQKSKYTLEAVEAIAEKLRAMPKVENKQKEVSKSEAVKLLAKEIKSMQKRNYTLKMIAEILTTNDLPITESVLKSYLQRSGAYGEAKEAKRAVQKEAEKEKNEAPEVTQPVKNKNLIEDVE